MRIPITSLAILLMAATLTSCSSSPTQEHILADSAFSGQALLDVNNNAQIDPEDTPIADAIFYVVINGVKAFGKTTDETGIAFILVPGGIEYPVEVRMDAPKNSTRKLITPSMVTVSASTGPVQFLLSR